MKHVSGVLFVKYLLVGLGSIGKRHLQNIRSIDPEGDITIWHTHTKRNGVNNSHNLANRVVYEWDEAINPKPDIALITGPASTHTPIALRLAHEGIDLFIEKPLSSAITNIDELLKVQKDHNILIMVGYNLRFHRPLQILKQHINEGKIGRIISIRAEVGQYLPEWRPGTDYRKSVSARKDLGGGAVLELSHELDYTQWLAGVVTEVTALTGHLSDLDLDVEDTAEIILKFSCGAIGSIHLDMVQQPPTRYCKVIGTNGTLIWDGTTDAVRLFSNAEGRWITLHSDQKEDWNHMYLSELVHFLSCVRERKEPQITAVQGKLVLQLALTVLRSSQEQRSITL